MDWKSLTTWPTSVTSGVFVSVASQIDQCLPQISSLTSPGQLIGPEEIHRVLAAGDDAEAEALICNPSVSDRLA